MAGPFDVAQDRHPDPFVLHFADLLAQKAPQRILDCGMGAGRNAFYLANCGHQVIGIDASSGMLSHARGGERVEPVQSRLESLPFVDRSFDALVCTHVLETMLGTGIIRGLEEMRRVLRPGGLLLIVTGAREAADARGGREIEPGTYAFDREERITVHLADREELSRWTAGFTTIARYLLTLEEPLSAPFCAQWAFFGRRV